MCPDIYLSVSLVNRIGHMTKRWIVLIIFVQLADSSQVAIYASINDERLGNKPLEKFFTTSNQMWKC